MHAWTLEKVKNIVHDPGKFLSQVGLRVFWVFEGRYVAKISKICLNKSDRFIAWNWIGQNVSSEWKVFTGYIEFQLSPVLVGGALSG